MSLFTLAGVAFTIAMMFMFIVGSLKAWDQIVASPRPRSLTGVRTPVRVLKDWRNAERIALMKRENLKQLSRDEKHRREKREWNDRRKQQWQAEHDELVYRNWTLIKRAMLNAAKEERIRQHKEIEETEWYSDRLREMKRKGVEDEYENIQRRIDFQHDSLRRQFEKV